VEILLIDLEKVADVTQPNGAMLGVSSIPWITYTHESIGAIYQLHGQ